MIVCGALASSREARAGENVAAAQAMFEEARTLMAKGNYAAACAKLEGSQSLDPGAGTEYNLALCYEKAGRTASAWATYLSAAASYKSTNRPDWETRARDRANVLASTLAKVTIVAPTPAPASLKITRDGEAVIPSEIGSPIPLDPGRHVIEAVADGRAKFSSTFVLAAGAKQTITVVMGNESVAPAAPLAGAKDSTDGGDSAHQSRVTLAYLLGGVGIAGLAVGSLSGLVAINKNDTSKQNCPNDGPCSSPSARDANSSASTWATISTVSMIAGGALLATGAIVFFTAPKASDSKTAARAYVSPALGLGSAGVMGAW
jgi:hypothetical protein